MDNQDDSNEFLINNEFDVSSIIRQQVNKMSSLNKVSQDKIVDKSFIDLVFSELKKANEIDHYIDTLEDVLNSPDSINRMQSKELMRWYELMNTRKNHTRKFLMAFYELASKNEYMSKIMTEMTGKKIDPKTLEQDDKTKTAKTIIQKIMQDKLTDI